jgi:hypothetical protein
MTVSQKFLLWYPNPEGDKRNYTLVSVQKWGIPIYLGQVQFVGIAYICALELIINDYEFRSFKSVLPRELLD